jgi:alpha-amylase
MRKDLFKLSMLAVAALTAVRCETLNIGSGGTTKPTEQSPVAIAVAPPSAQADVGSSFQFVAAVTGVQGASEVATWRSTNQAIATVDTAGLARCVASGTAQIEASAVADASKVSGASLTCIAAPAPQVELVNVTPGTVEVDVDRNATNEHVCAFRLQSSDGAVTFTFKSDHPALAAAVPGGSIPAGGFVIVSVFYKGGVSAPFSTTVRFVATSPQGTQEVQVPVKIGFK